MKKSSLLILLSLLMVFLSACSQRAPEAAPAVGLNPTVAVPPAPPSVQGDTEPAPAAALVDPFAALVFQDGWARIPFNASAFGGSGADQMNDVAAGGPGVVAVGYSARNNDLDAAAWFSDDGITWYRVTDSPELGGEGSQVINALILGPDGFVAVGSETLGTDSNAAVWFSEDGMNWSRVQRGNAAFGDENSQVMNQVTVFGDGFVAVGSEDTPDETRGAAWISPNGLSWQRVPHNDEAFGGVSRYVEFYRVLTVGSSLLTTGAVVPVDANDIDPGLWFSHDGGLTWTEITNSAETLGDGADVRYQFPGGIVQSRAGFFWVGTEQNTTDSPFGEYINGVIWHSPDGINWERIFEHKPDFHEQTMLDISSFLDGFVVVGYDLSGDQTQAAVWMSPDGVTFTQVQHSERVFGGAGPQRMNAVAAAGPGLVAVGATAENGDLDAAVWIYRSEP